MWYHSIILSMIKLSASNDDSLWVAYKLKLVQGSGNDNIYDLTLVWPQNTRPSFLRSSITLELLDLLLTLFEERYYWAPSLFLWFWCWQFLIEPFVELLDKSRSVKKRKLHQILDVKTWNTPVMSASERHDDMCCIIIIISRIQKCGILHSCGNDKVVQLH